MDRIHIRFKSFYVTTGQDRCRLGKTKEMKVECVWECGVTVSLPNLFVATDQESGRKIFASLETWR